MDRFIIFFVALVLGRDFIKESPAFSGAHTCTDWFGENITCSDIKIFEQVSSK